MTRPTAVRKALCLCALFGGLAMALWPWGDVSAAERRGSRILAYYRQASLTDPAAPAGSALTVVQVTNNSSSDGILLRVVLIDVASCEVSNLFTVPIAPGAVARLNVASLVPSSREGVLDAWVINDKGQPIQFNFLTADSTIADLLLPATIQVAAEVLGTTLGNYIAPLNLSGNFFQVPGVQQRMILMRPAPANALGTTLLAQDTVDFHTPDGGVVNRTVSRVATCIIADSLENLYGTGFASGLPDGGTVRAFSSTGPTVPLVGWLLHRFPLTGSTPSSLVMGIKLHAEQDGPVQ